MVLIKRRSIGGEDDKKLLGLFVEEVFEVFNNLASIARSLEGPSNKP
jgi:hypothetical protein